MMEIAAREAEELDPKEGCAICAELLRRAILTLTRVPDPDRRFLGYQNQRWEVVRRYIEAYGYETPKAHRFRPTPRDVEIYLDVLKWLNWLEKQTDGKTGVELITARAFGVPYWKLAQKYGKSEDTIRRWYDGAVSTVYGAFAHLVCYLRS